MAYREDRSGKVLERIVRDLERGGFEIGGDQLKTSPRGYDKDHPRIELLRHKSLLGMKKYGFEPFVHTAELLDRVRKDWRTLRPLVGWMAEQLER